MRTHPDAPHGDFDLLTQIVRGTHDGKARHGRRPEPCLYPASVAHFSRAAKTYHEEAHIQLRAAEVAAELVRELPRLAPIHPDAGTRLRHRRDDGSHALRARV